jgi:potassium voltage-gated channel KQT-like subfamily member 1
MEASIARDAGQAQMLDEERRIEKLKIYKMDNEAKPDENQKLLEPLNIQSVDGVPIASEELTPTTGPPSRKQIQFSFNTNMLRDSQKAEVTLQKQSSLKKEEYMNKAKNGVSSTPVSPKRRLNSLRHRLNQLKVEQIRKSRSSSGAQSTKKEIKKKVSCFRLNNYHKSSSELQAKLFNFLERPVGYVGLFYRLFTFTLIIGSITTGTLTTFKSFDKWSTLILFFYEIFATLYFTIEYGVRVWSVGHRPAYHGIEGRLKYIQKPLRLIELIVIIINIILLTFGFHIDAKTNQFHFKRNALTALRFFQILRILYVDRHGQTWLLLLKVVYKHRLELLTSVYIGLFILLFSSYLILIFENEYSEKNDDNHFHSFADAVYWSIITMTTIGYGDRSPRTFCGKIVATSLCIVGVAFWTLPGGIIGSGFALKVEKKNKKKQFNRLIPAAATLIQTWWRVKAAMFISSSNASCLAATINTFDISKPIYSSSLRRLRKFLDASCSELNTYFSGLDSQYKPLEPGQLPSEQIEGEQKVTNATGDKTFTGDASKKLLRMYSSGPYSTTGTNYDTYSTSFSQTNTINGYLNMKSSSDGTGEANSILLQLSPEHLILIRTILLLKFYAAKTKFKEAFKPYDFKDVIEQYTQGNMDVLLKIKELQRKIENISNVNRFGGGGSGGGGGSVFLSPSSPNTIQRGSSPISLSSTNNSNIKQNNFLASSLPSTPFSPPSPKIVHSFQSPQTPTAPNTFAMQLPFSQQQQPQPQPQQPNPSLLCPPQPQFQTQNASSFQANPQLKSSLSFQKRLSRLRLSSIEGQISEMKSDEHAPGNDSLTRSIKDDRLNKIEFEMISLSRKLDSIASTLSSLTRSLPVVALGLNADESVSAQTLSAPINDPPAADISEAQNRRITTRKLTRSASECDDGHTASSSNDIRFDVNF